MATTVTIDLGTDGVLTLKFKRRKDALRTYAEWQRMIEMVKERRLHGPPLTESEENGIRAMIGWMIEQAR